MKTAGRYLDIRRLFRTTALIGMLCSSLFGEGEKADSKSLLSDDLLARFGEKRLDEGSGEDNSIIRITYRRTGLPPVIATLQIPPQGPWKIVGKIPNPDPSQEGALIIKEKDLSKGQRLLVAKILSNSRYGSLPQTYPDDTLDGSTWIFEFAARESSLLIARRTPLSPVQPPELEEAKKIQEEYLRSLGILIWGLCDVAEDELD